MSNPVKPSSQISRTVTCRPRHRPRKYRRPVRQGETTYPDLSGEGQIAEAIKRISSTASNRIAISLGEIAVRRQKMRQTASSQADKEKEKEAIVIITHKSNILS